LQIYSWSGVSQAQIDPEGCLIHAITDIVTTDTANSDMPDAGSAGGGGGAIIDSVITDL
jgi:hypothetical protein